ncbi:MAG: CDP-alcohol phosphatidyltransferase family protein [Candidatus Riflebacteria bacterium]|nr:CDP-alcohol phosphatidyltransferase family protein [Candidatus Riflebacteria bacterium]
MTIYDLKPRFQDWLRPHMVRLHEAGATPNQLTLAALALSGATGVAIVASSAVPALLLLVPVALFVRMALNALDGMMAREFDLSSPTGQLLNEVGDVVSDVVLYLPFAVHVGTWPVVTFVVLALLTEFVGVVGQSICGERVYDGPMGKSDRAFAVGLLSLLLYWWPGTGWSLWFHLLSALTAVSFRNRCRRILGTDEAGR